MKKSTTPSARAAELAKLDLRPSGEGKKRTDELLRAMFNTPPEPFTPPAKKPKKARK